MFTANNFNKLLSPASRDHLEGIINAGLAAVDPRRAVEKSVIRQGNYLAADGRLYDLNSYQRVLVVGFGKAAVPMAAAIEDLLGERLDAGLVISKHIDAELAS